jgi:Helicase conserved C-terminal domain
LTLLPPPAPNPSLSPCRKSAVHAVLCHPNNESDGSRPNIVTPRSTTHRPRREESVKHVVCPSDRRFLLLFTYLKKDMKKVVVFFSSCNSVKYHAELLNYIDITVLDLHGKQKQQKRTTTFFEFCNAKQGTLLCPDVAARGLDIPAVDWIVQFDPPDDPRDYIHRVGRTARAGKSRKSLLFLLESELGFLCYLRDARVPLNEFGFPASRMANVQTQVLPKSSPSLPPPSCLLQEKLCPLLMFAYYSFPAGETLAEELLPASIGSGRVPFISPGLRVVLPQEDI